MMPGTRSQSRPDAVLAFGPATTQTPERAVAREWLLTNGLGDFACGTIAGPNTRRRHGLFTAAGAPGRPPMLLLAALDVTLEREGECFELSCHQFADSRHPKGFRLCTEFNAAPFPQWRYEVPGAILDFALFMPRERRATVCLWKLTDTSAGPKWRLNVRPILAYRDAGALTRANDQADLSFRRRDGGFSVVPYPGCPELFLQCAGAEIRADPCWYYRFQHAWDLALGEKETEDMFSPGIAGFTLGSGETAALVASLESEPVEATAAVETELRRLTALGFPGIESDSTATVFAQAAQSFTIKGNDGLPYILTGYPNPTGSGRAACIALPGLLLCTRRLKEARLVLEELLPRLGQSDALLDDVPLWLIRAGEQYVDHSRDWDFLREVLAPAAERSLERYLANQSDRGFRMMHDGLLGSNDKSCPLTWMDARIENWPVTPRVGKPVEVNALWHHALNLLICWSRRKRAVEAAEKYTRLRDLCGRSFRHRFWNPAVHGLHDFVDGDDGNDAAGRMVRPNQIFAVALPSDLLDRHQAEGVLRLVENRLLTPVGLRTLSLEERAFQPRYGGSKIERTAALHQGSVFPWLIGAYVDSVFRFYGRTASAYARAESCLQTLLHEHLKEGCIGHVSELFHGALPHAPRGAFAHAPAIAELIRVYVEIKGRLW